MTEFQNSGGRLRRNCVLALGAPERRRAIEDVKIIVPYTPGSGPDILSRLMANRSARPAGRPWWWRTGPGGGMMIGTEAAASAEPDGNTVLLVANSFVVNLALEPRQLHARDNFEPVCYLAGDADAARGAGLVALEDGAGAGRRRQSQSRQDHLRQRRARHFAACRDRGAPPRDQDRHQLRALRRQRPRDQCAARRPRAGGLGRLSDRGVAAQVRHLRALVTTSAKRIDVHAGRADH